MEGHIVSISVYFKGPWFLWCLYIFIRTVIYRHFKFEELLLIHDDYKSPTLNICIIFLWERWNPSYMVCSRNLQYLNNREKNKRCTKIKQSLERLGSFCQTKTETFLTFYVKKWSTTKIENHSPIFYISFPTQYVQNELPQNAEPSPALPNSIVWTFQASSCSGLQKFSRHRTVPPLPHANPVAVI